MISPPTCNDTANKSTVQHKKINRRKTKSRNMVCIDVTPEGITSRNGKMFQTGQVRVCTLALVDVGGAAVAATEDV